MFFDEETIQKSWEEIWDVIVVGGGHAGCEAALAAARLGSRTLLVTQSIVHLGTMPCNPSIGGLAKSHLVFEVDALGGEMATNTDFTGFQFRVLNSSRGPAVRANRVQCDKETYTERMAAVILTQPNLTCLQDECIGIIRNKKDSHAPCTGIRTRKHGGFHSKTVVITSGTAMKGAIYIGKEKQWSGGGGRPGASMLSDNLRKNGFELIRLKTGTPPRLDVRTIDWSAFQDQDSDTPAPVFSWRGEEVLKNRHCSTWNNLYDINERWNMSEEKEIWTIYQETIESIQQEKSTEKPIFETKIKNRPLAEGRGDCSTWNNLPSSMKKSSGFDAILPWEPFSIQKKVSMGHTTEETARIVRDHLADSALYGGPIKGTGVRYCPSFEDKIVKFTGKTEHHVILEPESRLSPAVYPNGLSNSLPRDIQEKMVHSVPGLEKSEFLAWGYAIEYDSIDARELNHQLESKRIQGLFFAGQVNGTTGYEEAAAQGLMAGMNASLRASGKEPLVLERSDAYIGVMIDDLVTKGTEEPYRMFTSRAERRLHLRQDNARFRLYEASKRIGLAANDFLSNTKRIMEQYENEIERLDSNGRDASGNGAWGRAMMHPGVRYSEMDFADPSLDPEAIRQIEFHYHYFGYLRQEEEQLVKMKKHENARIPADIDYFKIDALRYESRERLSKVRPETLAQASRIPGVNPADIAVLTIVIHKLRTACK